MVFNFRTTSFSFSSDSVAEDPEEIAKFSLDELKLATQNFKKSNMLGEGRSGRVYRGRLTDGSLVAIKRLEIKGGLSEKHFKTEVEMASLATLHPNILRLKGLCLSVEERLLVYPLMVNDNLASHLNPKRKKGYQPLDWMTRKRVALGSARGIAHLHHHCNPAIIHRDISASNILLDENFEAVVGDFGLARTMNEEDVVEGSIEWILPIHSNSDHSNSELHGSIYCYSDVYVTTTVCGTPGYIAPEYLLSGKCTTKSDVFAFGIVLLELFTGQKISGLLDYAKRQGKLLVPWLLGLEFSELLNKWVDQKLINKAVVELEQFVELALHCLQDNPASRPEMLEVVAILESLVTPECDEEKEHNITTHSTLKLVGKSDVSPLAISHPFEETCITGLSNSPIPPGKTNTLCSPSQVSNSLVNTKVEIKQCPNGLTILFGENTPLKLMGGSGYPQSSMSQEPSSIDGLLENISREGDLNLTSDLYRNNVVREENYENSTLEYSLLRKGNGETTKAHNEPLLQAIIQRNDHSCKVSSTENLLLDEYVSVMPSFASIEELEQLFVNLKTKVSASLPTVPLEDTMIQKGPVSKAELLEAMEMIESAMAIPPCSQSINLTGLNSAFSKLMELENAGLRVGVVFDIASIKERTFEAVSIVANANDTISEVDSTEKRMLALDASFESAHPLFTQRKNCLTQVQAQINVLEERLAAFKLLESELRGDINNLYSKAAQDGKELSRLKHSWTSLAKNRERARQEKEQAMKDWESLRALIMLCRQQL